MLAYVETVQGSPLRQQFSRFTSRSTRSLLPSLALAGLSCHCIHRVETQDSLEVLAFYRCVAQCCL